MRAIFLFQLAVMIVFTASLEVQADTFLSKRAEEWARQLSSREVGPRRSAVFALGRIGTESERYLPRLLEIVRSDPNNPLRADTSMAIGEIILSLGARGPETWPTLGPSLLEILSREKETSVRRGLLFALGAFGEGAAPAGEQFLAGLKDPNAIVRQTASWATGRLGPKAPEASIQILVSLLFDKTPLVRRDAAGALGDIGLPLAREAFIPMLELVEQEAKAETGDSTVLKTALERLVQLTDPDRLEDARRLQVLLKAEDPEIARAAAFAMARMHPVRDLDTDDSGKTVEVLKSAVPVLREALGDEDPAIVELAAAALGRLGPTAAEAVPDLGRILASPDPRVRRNAAVALGHIGQAAGPAIGALLKALTSSPQDLPENRARYAEAISYIRYPANAEALPVIVKMMETEKDTDLRRMCVVTFFPVKDLQIAGAGDALNRLLDETDEAGLIVRYNAAVVLATHLHEKASDKVVSTLLHMLTNDNLRRDKGTQTRVEQTGGESGSNQASVASGLEGDGRYIAAYGLGNLHKKGNQPEIIKALEEASRDKNEKLKKTAIEALKVIRQFKP